MNLAIFVCLSAIIVAGTALEAWIVGDLSGIGAALIVVGLLVLSIVVAIQGAGGMSAFLSAFVDRLPTRKTRMIKVDGEKYLGRFHLFSVGRLEVYLHQFHGQADQHLHDHPFRAICLMLCGSYVETRGLGMRQRVLKAPAINCIGAGTVHQITRVVPGTWTLMIAWRTLPDWHLLQENLGPSSNWYTLTRIVSDQQWWKVKK